MKRASWYYKLVGRIAVPCSVQEWAECFEKMDRHVAYTEIGAARVSTVFLGLDHSLFDDGPLIFETMVFSDDSWADAYCERYHTWDEAEKGHSKVVEEVKQKYDQLAQTVRPISC